MSAAIKNDGTSWHNCPILLHAIVAAAVLLSHVSVSDTLAQTVINDGDIFVNNMWTGITRVNPDTGAKTELGSIALGGYPRGIAFDGNGHIIAAQSIIDSGTPAIIRFDPVTGSKSIVSSGNLLTDPLDVAIAPNGDIYVSQNNGPIVRVDSVTGEQSSVAPASNHTGIAVDAYGVIYDLRSTGRLYRINPDVNMLWSLGVNQDQFAVDIGGTGDILVGVFGYTTYVDRIVRVDRTSYRPPGNGLYETVSQEGQIQFPAALAVEADGDIIMTNLGWMSSPTVIRIDPENGDQQYLATITTGQFQDLYGVAVYIHPKPAGLVVARPSMRKAGSVSISCENGPYIPSEIDIDDTNSEYLTIFGVKGEPADEDVSVMLDFALTGSTTVGDILADFVARGFTATDDDPGGLLSTYGYDILLTFDNPHTGGPLFFAWDFSQYADVLVDRLGVIPTSSADTDGDGVPDPCDLCPGHDDRVDIDGDNIPDCTESEL